MSTSELFDIRTPLWTASFKAALPYGEFITTGGPAHQSRWKAYEERINLTPSQLEMLGAFKRRMNVLVLAGTWCGDCARQCPMLEAIASATPAINLRFIDNQVNGELRDELRIHGAARVPVAVSLSEDFFEIGRSSDRQLSAYRRKAKTELGDACDAGIVAPTSDEVAEELAEWVAYFERQQLLLRVSPFLRRRHND